MVKIIDHQQTGNRKFIRGPGLKKDRDLRIYETGLNQIDKKADRILFKNEEVKKEEVKKEVVKKVKVIKITDRFSKRHLIAHLKKAEAGKRIKGILCHYKRYGKLVENRWKFINFLQQRLKGVRSFKV